MTAVQTQASIVLHWKLDETNGSPTVADSSGNGNVGTVTNMGFLPTGGILGGCAYGTNAGSIFQMIYMKPGPVTNFPFSASIWWNNGTVANNNCMLSLGTGIFNVYEALLGRGSLVCRSNLQLTLQPNPIIAGDSKWHNIVGVWINSTNRISYLDGVAMFTNTVFQDNTNSPYDRFAVGALFRQDFPTAPANAFQGRMDDAAVWNEAISPQQVAAINALGVFGCGTADDVSNFLAAFNASSSITFNNGGTITWARASGLTGNIGTTGGIVADKSAYVVLDNSGNGMQVTVAQVPPVATLSVSPSQIFAGDTTASLSWTTAGADSVTINQGIGSVSTSGTQGVTPVVTTTWTLVASNTWGMRTNFVTLPVFAAPGPLKLAVHWTLDETGGTTATNSLGAYSTGQFVVATNLIAPVWEPTSGYLGGDLRFTSVDNTNNVVVRANLAGVALTNFPFALAAWVNTTDNGQAEPVVSLINSNANDQYFSMQMNGGFVRETARNGLEYDTNGTVINDGSWHYVVVDFERIQIRNIYVDGALLASDNIEQPFVSFNRLSVGALDRMQGISNPLLGAVDDVALFTGTLAANDVSVFYGAMTGLKLNTGEINTIRSAFLGGMNSLAVHGAVWTPTHSLAGTAGTTGGSLATQDAFIVMDNSGNGMQITANFPGISGISPSSPVTGSSGSQTLTITGINFQPGCTITLTNVDTGVSNSPAVTFVNSSNLTVSAAFTVTPHNWSVQVINPGNIVSTPLNFTVAAPPQPRIGSLSLVSGKVVLNGTNGTAGLAYSVLTATNVALPVASWTPLTTNVFGAGGSFGWTNAIDPTKPQSFYLIKP